MEPRACGRRGQTLFKTSSTGLPAAERQAQVKPTPESMPCIGACILPSYRIILTVLHGMSVFPNPLF